MVYPQYSLLWVTRHIWHHSLYVDPTTQSPREETSQDNRKKKRLVRVKRLIHRKHTFVKQVMFLLDCFSKFYITYNCYLLDRQIQNDIQTGLQSLTETIQLPSRSPYVYWHHSWEAEVYCIRILSSETTNDSKWKLWTETEKHSNRKSTKLPK